MENTMSKLMSRRIVSRVMLSAAAGCALLLANASLSQAQTFDMPQAQFGSEIEQNDFAQATDDQRLMIVNGNSGRVIYNDGRDDLYCQTRLRIAGYNHHGRPIYRRTMRCR
jgi:hypothetical protein